jgi:hypothetical protein
MFSITHWKCSLFKTNIYKRSSNIYCTVALQNNIQNQHGVFCICTFNVMYQDATLNTIPPSNVICQLYNFVIHVYVAHWNYIDLSNFTSSICGHNTLFLDMTSCPLNSDVVCNSLSVVWWLTTTKNTRFTFVSRGNLLLTLRIWARNSQIGYCFAQIHAKRYYKFKFEKIY